MTVSTIDVAPIHPDSILQTREEFDKGEVGHYVMSPDDNETNHAYVMRARLEGFPVEALCGYVWIPHKVASNLPVCPECEEISKNYDPGTGEDPKE